MSGQAIVNPDELEKFANSITAFVNNIDDAMGELQGRFNVVNDTWQDAQRDSFEEVYNELLQCLSRFKEAASEQVPYLNSKVAQAREYLES
jgi:uncharacterized protein YukE